MAAAGVVPVRSGVMHMMALFETSTRWETSSTVVLVSVLCFSRLNISQHKLGFTSLNKCIFQIACTFNPTSFGMHKTTQSVLSQASQTM